MKARAEEEGHVKTPDAVVAEVAPNSSFKASISISNPKLSPKMSYFFHVCALVVGHVSGNQGAS